MTVSKSRVDAVLARIRENDSEGNPEGRTEVHSYHVWEVLNALEQESREWGGSVTGRLRAATPAMQTFRRNSMRARRIDRLVRALERHKVGSPRRRAIKQALFRLLYSGDR